MQKGSRLRQVLEIAEKAGEAIIKIYSQANYEVKLKSDSSPVTEADIAAHTLLVQELHAIEPHYPVLSEENADEISFEERQQWPCFWLIDPLDGTREFIKKTGEFCINIALIEQHQPVLGVVLLPVFNQCFYAEKGKGAFFEGGQGQSPERLHVKTGLNNPIQVVASFADKDNPNLYKLLGQLPPHNLVFMGSALKLAKMVATGKADLYPRFASSGEWDTAAGQCILQEAGGKFTDLHGKPFRYNERRSLINPGYLASGDNELTILCCG